MVWKDGRICDPGYHRTGVAATEGRDVRRVSLDRNKSDLRRCPATARASALARTSARTVSDGRFAPSEVRRTLGRTLGGALARVAGGRWWVHGGDFAIWTRGDKPRGGRGVSSPWIRLSCLLRSLSSDSCIECGLICDSTHLVKAGPDIRTVQERFGHRRLQVRSPLDQVGLAGLTGLAI